MCCRAPKQALAAVLELLPPDARRTRALPFIRSVATSAPEAGGSTGGGAGSAKDAQAAPLHECLAKLFSDGMLKVLERLSPVASTSCHFLGRFAHLVPILCPPKHRTPNSPPAEK